MVAIEKGLPTVQFGHWLRVIEALGLERSFAEAVSLKHDEFAIECLMELAPQRAGATKRRR